MKLIVGAALPSVSTFLPSPEDLVQWPSARDIRTPEAASDTASEGVVRSSGLSGVPPRHGQEQECWQAFLRLWQDAALATRNLNPQAVLAPALSRLQGLATA